MNLLIDCIFLTILLLILNGLVLLYQGHKRVHQTITASQLKTWER